MTQEAKAVRMRHCHLVITTIRGLTLKVLVATIDALGHFETG